MRITCALLAATARIAVEEVVCRPVYPYFPYTVTWGQSGNIAHASFAGNLQHLGSCGGFGWEYERPFFFLSALDSELSTLQAAVLAFDQAAEQKIADLQATVAGLQLQIAADQAEEAAEAPPSVVVVDNIDAVTDFKKVVGSNIGGTAPTSYGFTHVPNPFPAANMAPDTVLQLSVAGPSGQFSDWLASKMFPGVVPPAEFALEFEILCDGNVATLAQALESDTMLILDGSKFNYSGQIAVYKNGAVQIWNPSPAVWVDSGIVLGSISPNVWHRVRWDYSFDRAGKTYRYLAFSFDGTKYDLSSTAPRPALPSTWTSGTMIQLQQDLDSKGGSYSTFYRKMRYAT